ncbi:hypothetical protein AOQ84DRAFT_197147 [Glonium stellatum]|uniref:Uncharacterized protein n=1 Tax=Glonium stellatum TaxID=574774 RepID=A0A8E2JVJ5_9PEZI|nr:hypothetical protein AOQ84DRAFT_197147 [Glonium stellatum]
MGFALPHAIFFSLYWVGRWMMVQLSMTCWDAFFLYGQFGYLGLGLDRHLCYSSLSPLTVIFCTREGGFFLSTWRVRGFLGLAFSRLARVDSPPLYQRHSGGLLFWRCFILVFFLLLLLPTGCGFPRGGREHGGWKFATQRWGCFP